MAWFCGICGTELIYDDETRIWWCPKCNPNFIDQLKTKQVCDSYAEGFKDGYNRALDDMSEGIKR